MARKDPKEQKELRKKEQSRELYRTRLLYLKQAQNYAKEDHVLAAVDAYTKYLGILSLHFDTTEEKLSPSLFNVENDLSELLLVSHAYLDLAKAYDRNPKLHKECVRCIDQFVKFSIGFKYQHVNAQMLRKFILKKQAHNLQFFEQAYQKIQIASKKCYLATSCFGEDHSTTHTLREFKHTIAPYFLGQSFIDFYYLNSPRAVEIMNQSKPLKFFEQMAIKPALFLFAIIYKWIKKLCPF